MLQVRAQPWEHRAAAKLGLGAPKLSTALALPRQRLSWGSVFHNLVQLWERQHLSGCKHASFNQNRVLLTFAQPWEHQIRGSGNHGPLKLMVLVFANMCMAGTGVRPERS